MLDSGGGNAAEDGTGSGEEEEKMEDRVETVSLSLMPSVG